MLLHDYRLVCEISTLRTLALTKNQKFIWSDDCEDLFVKLKAALNLN